METGELEESSLGMGCGAQLRRREDNNNNNKSKRRKDTTEKRRKLASSHLANSRVSDTSPDSGSCMWKVFLEVAALASVAGVGNTAGLHEEAPG